MSFISNSCCEIDSVVIMLLFMYILKFVMNIRRKISMQRRKVIYYSLLTQIIYCSTKCILYIKFHIYKYAYTLSSNSVVNHVLKTPNLL